MFHFYYSGAPAGSLLIGPSALIAKARRIRKALGGGMRQVGILASAGLIAISDFERGILEADHAKARMIADSISGMKGFFVDFKSVHTNILLIELDCSCVCKTLTPAAVVDMLKALDVWILPFGPNNMRLVTHRDITDAQVVEIIDAFQNISSKITVGSS